MTVKRSPPPNKARKLTGEAEAEVGQPRECDQCHETKSVNNVTFYQKRAGVRGWSTTCRKCLAASATAAAKASGRSGRPAPGRVKSPPKRIEGFEADPLKAWSDFEKELDAKVERLAELSSRPRPSRALIEPLLKELKAATRLWDDPAPWGRMTDERLAFKAFQRVLKPNLSGWQAPGPIHEDILDALLCPDPNVVLLASRGSAKSTITTQYATWKVWRDPEAEVVLIVSRSEALARKQLKAIAGYIQTSPLLEELRPDDDQLDSAYQLEVRPAKAKLGMSSSFTCRGLTGQITGLRARVIVGDDIESPKDDSSEAVDRVEEAIAEFQHVAVPGATITLLGTPQSEFSLYGRLARSDAWTTFTACLFESDILDGVEVFESRWPDRFTPGDIEKIKRSVSKRQFALHHRLDLSTTVLKEHPFKLADLPVLDWPSSAAQAPIEIVGGGPRIEGLPRGTAEATDDWRAIDQVSEDVGPYTMVVAAVDPASGLAGKDAIGLAIVGVTVGGNVIIRVATGVRADTTQEAMKRVAGIIAEHRANKLLVEESAAGLMGQNLSSFLAMRGHPLTYTRVATGGVKKARRIIDAISPALASGRVFVCRDVLTHEDAGEFVSQFTGLSHDARTMKHDDTVDALSYALSEVGAVFAADPSDFIAAARVDWQAIAQQPLRRRVLDAETLEEFAEIDEHEEALRLKLDHALNVQIEDVRNGMEDPSLQQHIDRLQRDLSKYRTVSRPRAVQPDAQRLRPASSARSPAPTHFEDF